MLTELLFLTSISYFPFFFPPPYKQCFAACLWQCSIVSVSFLYSSGKWLALIGLLRNSQTPLRCCFVSRSLFPHIYNGGAVVMQGAHQPPGASCLVFCPRTLVEKPGIKSLAMWLVENPLKHLNIADGFISFNLKSNLKSRQPSWEMQSVVAYIAK